MSATKVCENCRQRRPVSDFFPHWKTKDGLRSTCIACPKGTSGGRLSGADGHETGCQCQGCQRRRELLDEITKRIRTEARRLGVAI